MPADVVLTGSDLTIADIEAVARGDARARLDYGARAKMQAARDVIESLVAEGAVVYGVTTGFGDLATSFIDPSQAGRLQENLLMSHAAGVGRAFPREVVRAMLLLRANTLALGHSGCRPLIVDRLLAFLEEGIHPVVPEQGSLGASGDLAPLAHLALPIIGRGDVEHGGRVVPAAEAARAAGLEPLTLEAKEGLALLNGTQMMGAIGALFLADADRLVRTASVAAASRSRRCWGPTSPSRLPTSRRGPIRARSPSPRSCATCSERAGSSVRIMDRPTRSRTLIPCAAYRRCTARSVTPSTTSVASLASS